MTTTPAHLRLAASQMGYNENAQNAALQEYLSNGGVDLDPAVTAWCAAFVNATLGQTGMVGTGSNLARSFMDWGVGVDEPQIGDVAVFSRGDPNGWQGHVGFFQGYDDAGNILVLGGNQSDGVNVSPYSADRLLGFRRADGTNPESAAQPGLLGRSGGDMLSALGGLLGPRQPQQDNPWLSLASGLSQMSMQPTFGLLGRF